MSFNKPLTKNYSNLVFPFYLPKLVLRLFTLYLYLQHNYSCARKLSGFQASVLFKFNSNKKNILTVRAKFLNVFSKTPHRHFPFVVWYIRLVNAMLSCDWLIYVIHKNILELNVTYIITVVCCLLERACNTELSKQQKLRAVEPCIVWLEHRPNCSVG